jgi:ergothioneine biosynthesis protein EgtB
MAVDRDRVLHWFEQNRARTRELFALVDQSCYYERPIPLRNPMVFYEGHLPGFSLNTHVKAALKEPGVDERLELLFARGIDPDDEMSADRAQASSWPSRPEVLDFCKAADERMDSALRNAPLERRGDPMLERGLSIFTSLEHEAMHQETLLYLIHRIDPARKLRPAGYQPFVDGSVPPPHPVTIPAGTARLGTRKDTLDFGWDNEFAEHQVQVPSFTVDAFNVTNAEFMEFIDSGAYDDRSFWPAFDDAPGPRHRPRHPLFWERHDGAWFWRGQFGILPLPAAWPAWVTQAEASAYARWRGKRLMTEAEFDRAAHGGPAGEDRAFPWGEEPPDETRGNFGFARWDPMPVGSYPAGASAWGIHDLYGNGWEWTSTLFGPFPGFTPMASYPQYSADFFDGKHFVMKGGSPATALQLIRRSFRNWFRPNYPYVYATFRCVA